MGEENINTTYGIIPINELSAGVIPNRPTSNLLEYLPKLYIKEIDEISSHIKLKLKNKLVPLNETILMNQNINDLFNKVEYFKAGAGKPTTLPKKLNPKLAYFIGYFLGDGGLKDIQKTYCSFKRFEYKLKLGDEFLLQIKFLQTLFRDLFAVTPPVRTERIEKGERLFYLNPTSKVIYRFLTRVFEMPPGPKTSKLKVPKIILSADLEIKKWFVRGVFDADGDTRTVEGGFRAQPRVKLRMKCNEFVSEMKKLLQETFNVSVNGPYFDKKWDSSYIQIERHKDIISLHKQKFFLHPIKKWRLEKTYLNLVQNNKHLKQFTQ